MKKTAAASFVAFLLVSCGGISIPSRDPGPPPADVPDTTQPDLTQSDLAETAEPDVADGERSEELV